MFQSPNFPEREAEVRTVEELKSILTTSLTTNAFSGCGLEIQLRSLSSSTTIPGESASLISLYTAAMNLSLPSDEPEVDRREVEIPVSSSLSAENNCPPPKDEDQLSAKPTSALSRMISKAKQEYQTKENRRTTPTDGEQTSSSTAPKPTLKRCRSLSEGSESSEFGIEEELLISTRAPIGQSNPTTLEQKDHEKKHVSLMTREEFLQQFKRVPRRGEIGQSAEEIQAAESLGYVMSGGRSKSAQMYVDRVQRQLHERDAAKREQQFRQVEDELNNTQLIADLSNYITQKVRGAQG